MRVDVRLESSATRERWLQVATDSLRPYFGTADLQIPPARVSVGFPSRRAFVRRRRVVGECWPAGSTDDGVPQIFISPTVGNAVDVLAILVHELIHACLPGAGHGVHFRKAAVQLGLTGKMTATIPGARLLQRLNAIAAEVGPYPHAAINANTAAKQPTRLRLWQCACPIKARVASDDFRAICGRCHTSFYCVPAIGAK